MSQSLTDVMQPFDGMNEILSAWNRGIRPALDFLVSQWADQNRVLDKPFTKVRQDWDTEKVPYTREIMDCLSARSPVQRVSWMKSAQVSGSETGNNWLGYIIEQAPGMVMLINPTKAMAKRMSARVQALIDSSPLLRELVRPSRERDSGNTQFLKKFPGGLLVIVGAQSGPDLRSYACQYLFFDEADAMPVDVDNEGHPITVAEARTYGQGDRFKIYINSTPLIEQTSAILKEWLRGDQRYYFMPCPHTGRLIRFEFKNLVLDAPGRHETAKYRCTCGCEQNIIEGTHKTAMMRDGVWVPRTIWSDPAAFERLSDGDRTELEAFNKTSLERSYHISALYSPIGWMSWRRIMKLWDEAQGAPSLLKAFKNTVLGECWTEIGEAPDWEVVYGRRSKDYRQRQLMRDVIFLTAGADVGVDHIEVSIVGYSRRRKRRLVEHIRIDGAYNAPETWARLDDILERKYQHPSGALMGIRRLCIDRGKWTDIVDAWVATKDPTRVTAVKGYDHLDMPFRWSGSKKQHRDGTESKKNAVKWAMAGVSHLKLELFGQLNMGRDETGIEPPGWVYLPSDVTESFVKQLVSERAVYRATKGGRPKRSWEEIGDRHEALDTMNYSRVAAAIEGWDDWTEVEFRREEDRLVELAEANRIRIFEWEQLHGMTDTDLTQIVPGLVTPEAVPDFSATGVDRQIAEPSVGQVEEPQSVVVTDRPSAAPIPAAPEIGIAGCRAPITFIPMPDYGGGDEDDDD